MTPIRAARNAFKSIIKMTAERRMLDDGCVMFVTAFDQDNLDEALKAAIKSYKTHTESE